MKHWIWRTTGRIISRIPGVQVKSAGISVDEIPVAQLPAELREHSTQEAVGCTFMVEDVHESFGTGSAIYQPDERMLIILWQGALIRRRADNLRDGLTAWMDEQI